MRSFRLVTVLGFLLLYVPMSMVIVYSFLAPVAGPGSELGFTLDWYRKIFSNEEVLSGLQMSLLVGLASTAISTVIGTAAALAIQRSRFPGRKLLDTITYVPLVMPEIVLGLALLIWFVLLRISLGSVSLILAHVTFNLSYVIISVRSRLRDFDQSIEEAAFDLGANSWQVFWQVTLPMIWPGILTGALMAFTLSFDDFLISFFTTGPGADTLPLKIYSMIKFGMSPEIHALSALMFGFTVLAVVAGFSGMSRLQESRPEER
jgi:spermidine/putrescine transport system permease protein